VRENLYDQAGDGAYVTATEAGFALSDSAGCFDHAPISEWSRLKTSSKKSVGMHLPSPIPDQIQGENAAGGLFDQLGKIENGKVI